MNDDYEVHFISFKNVKTGNSFTVFQKDQEGLLPGQREALDRLMERLDTVNDASDLV